MGFAVAAWAYTFVSDVYLCHADRVAGVRVMEDINLALSKRAGWARLCAHADSGAMDGVVLEYD